MLIKVIEWSEDVQGGVAIIRAHETQITTHRTVESQLIYTAQVQYNYFQVIRLFCLFYVLILSAIFQF